jgi:hypothetical protein
MVLARQERLRCIRNEMPHLSVEETKQLCDTLYETRHADAVELLAAEDAARTMIKVIKGGWGGKS